MEVYQQLAGFGGGLPVDVLHGVAPHVAPQARKGKGVVVDLLAAGEVAHNLGEGDLDALGGNQPGQHVKIRGLGVEPTYFLVSSRLRTSRPAWSMR